MSINTIIEEQMFESFMSFFSGLHMEQEKDSIELYEQYIWHWHLKSIKQLLEAEVERHKKQIAIHTKIIETHDVAPFEWHRGRIDEAEANITHLTNIIKEIK